MMYKCMIAYPGDPDTLTETYVEAENMGEALVVSSRQNPNSYVKIIEEAIASSSISEGETI